MKNFSVECLLGAHLALVSLRGFDTVLSYVVFAEVLGFFPRAWACWM